MTVLNCINELILRRDWQIKSAVSMDSGLNPIFSRAVVTGDSGHLICCLGSVVVVEGIGALMYRASFPLVKSIRSIISFAPKHYEMTVHISQDLIAHMRFASGKLCRVNSTGDFWIARLPRLKWAMVLNRVVFMPVAKQLRGRCRSLLKCFGESTLKENIIDAKVAVLCANIVFFSNSAMELWLRWKLKKDTGSGSYAFLIDTLHAQIAPSRQALVHPPLHTLHRCWMNCLCKMIRAHALSLIYGTI
ncbi:hypothetical protein NC653_004897 [Populus alba x Populus x berolinensis]|uniref:Uncharacterized protein n=1 Tax=Populus alba x Populus x berolinensis TaxID=444605 RepID=A0AAD6WAM1_9ROSI|nr:hypothetical protein NC653_004897 [Populus alba x Populus x berolinensis]